jgi:hypothetical protein
MEVAFHFGGQIDSEAVCDGTDISDDIDKLDHDLFEVLRVVRTPEEFDVLVELARFFGQVHCRIPEDVFRVDPHQHFLVAAQ